MKRIIHRLKQWIGYDFSFPPITEEDVRILFEPPERRGPSYSQQEQDPGT